MADVVLRNNQNVNFTVIHVRDAIGSELTGATITWAANPGGYFILAPSSDGISCNVKSNGQITAPAPGGIVSIVATATITGVGSGTGSQTVQTINSSPFTVSVTHDTPVDNV